MREDFQYLYFWIQKLRTQECLGGSVKHLTFDLSSGLDLRVVSLRPALAPHWVWTLLLKNEQKMKKEIKK